MASRTKSKESLTESISETYDPVTEDSSKFEFGDSSSLDLPDGDVVLRQAERSLRAVKENINNGVFGERGEQYVFAQAFLVLCILGGGLPVFGPYLQTLFGPVLLLAGVLIAGAAVLQIDDGLSPYPVTNDRSKLRTDGIYAYIRHPMYTGLLCTMLGGSIMSNSASRIILTIVLYFVLDLKSNYEEKGLVSKFPAYDEYSQTVSGKFLPATLTDSISSLSAMEDTNLLEAGDDDSKPKATKGSALKP